MSGVPSAFIGPVLILVVLVNLFSEWRMSGVPSAFILVLLVEVDDLVMPEGVVIVLDLFTVPEPLVMVLDLVMPAGLLIVEDFTIVLVAGACMVLVVVIFDELVFIWVVAGVAVWAWAAAPPSIPREMRNPRMRFMGLGMS